MDNNRGVIKYETANDFKRCHATGFFGGLNNFGELVFTIIEDVHNMPPKEVQLVPDPNQSGVLLEQHEPKNLLEIKRIGHVEVTMPISVVPSIIEWFERKLREYETKYPTEK